VIVVFFFQAEDGIRDRNVTGVQTCALPILYRRIVSPYHYMTLSSKCMKENPLRHLRKLPDYSPYVCHIVHLTNFYKKTAIITSFYIKQPSLYDINNK